MSCANRNDMPMEKTGLILSHKYKVTYLDIIRLCNFES